VVILSGDSGQGTVAELLDGGAAGFLAKPFTVPELIATVDRFREPFRAPFRGTGPGRAG
jgi:CheY-like chemotaxis protein